MDIPKSILDEFERLTSDLNGFGRAGIMVTLHDYKARFTLSVEKSVIPGVETSGGVQGARHD